MPIPVPDTPPTATTATPLPFGATLTVNRYGPRDKYGHLPAATGHAIGPCALAPAGSVENTSGVAVVLEQDTIYAPFESDVQASDEIVIPAGEAIQAGIYQVDGNPQRWKSPFTGRTPGMVIRLTRTTA